MSTRRLRNTFAILLAGTVVAAVAIAESCRSDAGNADTRDATPGEMRTEVEERGDTTIVRTLDFERRFAILREEISIGVFDGEPEYVFGSIGLVAPRPEGSVCVFDGRAIEIRCYDSRGRFERRIGRLGEGPGEYGRAINGLRVLPDGSIAAWSPRDARFTVWDSTGTFAWQRRLGSRISGLDNRIAAGTGEAIVVYAAIPRRSEVGSPPTPQGGKVRFLGPDTPLDTIFPPVIEDPGFEEWVQGDARFYRFRTPFAPELLHYAHGPDAFLVATGETYRIDRVADDGSVLRVEVDADPVPVHPDEAEARRRSVTESARSVDPGWDWRGPPVPETKPFIRVIEVGGGGRIWVYAHQPSERRERPPPEDEPDAEPSVRWIEPRLYDVFEPEGRYLCSVEVPEGMDFRAYHGDRIWASAYDSLEVPRLKRLRLECPGEGEPPYNRTGKLRTG